MGHICNHYRLQSHEMSEICGSHFLYVGKPLDTTVYQGLVSTK